MSLENEKVFNFFDLFTNTELLNEVLNNFLDLLNEKDDQEEIDENEDSKEITIEEDNDKVENEVEIEDEDEQEEIHEFIRPSTKLSTDQGLQIHKLVQEYVDTMIKPYLKGIIDNNVLNDAYVGLYEFAAWILTK